MLVYRAMESMRFGATIGALSQSPESYCAVAQVNSAISAPRPRAARAAAARRAGHGARR